MMSRSASHDVSAATRAGLPSAATRYEPGSGSATASGTDPESGSESDVLDPGGGLEAGSRGRRRCAASCSRLPSATLRPFARMMTRSATRSASASSWVVSRTPAPRSLRAAAIDPPYCDASLGVDPGGRLVQEDDVGPADECECQGDALLLASGQPLPRRLRDPVQIEKLGEAPPGPPDLRSSARTARRPGGR